ncbi:MAG TPA: nitrilase-related carbon-nitrogen hydrolase, partial [Ignavibacteriaceae bacterium]
MNKSLKLSLVQYNPIWEDKSANKEKLNKMIEELEQTDLIVFPEMTLTGFTMKSSEFAEKLTDETFSYFSKLAKGKKCAIMYGVIEKGKKKNFNTLIHLNNQG